jgi:hypothetical protein
MVIGGGAEYDWRTGGTAARLSVGKTVISADGSNSGATVSTDSGVMEGVDTEVDAPSPEGVGELSGAALGPKAQALNNNRNRPMVQMPMVQMNEVRINNMA